MSLGPDLQKVPLANIIAGQKFLMSFARPLQPLLCSIRQIGQTTPLLARETRRGPELFSGFRRLAALKELGKKSVLVLTWKGSRLSEKQALRMAFFENVAVRGLNLVEQAMAVTAFQNLGLSKKSITRSCFLPAALPASAAVIDSLAGLMLLEHDWKIFLVEKNISLRHASELARLKPEERSALKTVLPLRPTASQFREILETTTEIARREQMSVAELLQNSELRAILSAQGRPAPQKLESLLQALYKIRHPHYVRLMARHTRLCQHLSIPAELEIVPTDFFEKPQYQLKMALTPRTEARKIFQKLLTAASSPAWKKLFELDEQN
jgi:ParB-like chromosome segregation protein Spo0J